MAESVNHPDHYNLGGIEVIDAVEAWGFGEGFNRGNAIKYIARAGRKDPETEIEDLKKACWYIQREVERLGGSMENVVKASDRVEVLRCRDCTFYRPDEAGVMECINGLGYTKPDDYCSQGVRVPGCGADYCEIGKGTEG